MRIFLLTVFLVFSLLGNAASYYFSTAEGDDSRSPETAQNPATPWKSLRKLNAFSSSLKPGDTVYFKRGDVFEGNIVLAKSGLNGSPIVFAAYGSGNKPVISGLTSLNAFAPFSGNIWVQNLNAGRPAILLLNGKQQPYGRYPNSVDANGGFLTVDSHHGTSAITSKDLNGSADWTGGEMVIRKTRWIIDRCPIVRQSGKTIFYTNTSQYEPTDQFGFFIQNHVKALDTNGEWAFDAAKKKLYLYSSNFSAGTDVKVSVVDTLVSINNKNYISFQDLQFSGANETLLSVANASNISVTGCSFTYAGLNAAWFNYASVVTIENSSFESNNNNAITTLFGCRAFRIRNNTFTNTGIYPGMGKSGDLGYQAITIKGKNNIVENNRIENTGYVPIRFEGDTVVIRRNFINSFAFLKDDGAGIYTWNNDAGAPDNPSRVVKDNIVLNGVGAGQGTSHPEERHAHGIYLDDNAANVDISGNTVANCAEAGLYIHNARNSVARDNTLFNNGLQVYLQHDNVSPTKPVRNFQLKGNVLYAKTPTQQLVRMKSVKDDINSFGTSDSNFYNRPFNPEPFNYTAYTRNYNEYVQVYDLASWQGAFLKDLHSKKAPVQFPRYKINAATGPNRISNSTFDHNIYTVYGYYYSGAFNMEWNSGGKLDGGSLQATFNPATNNRGFIIMDVGSVTAGKAYVLKFSMLSKSNNKSLTLFLRKTKAPYSRISDYSFCKVVDRRSENEFVFVPTETSSAGSIVFDISDQATLWLDNVSFQEANVTVPNPDNYIRFEYNASSASKTIALDGSYVDGKGNTYEKTVTLEPFRSVVLLRSQPTAKKEQRISFPSPENKAYGDTAFALKATATSRLDVSYRVVSGPATITGNTVTLTGTGKVVIEASQAGDLNFNAADPVTQSFTIKKASQRISFGDISNKSFGDAPFDLKGSASSGLPIRFRVVSGHAMVSGATVSVTGIGSVVVEAAQDGNDNFEAASPVTQTFRVEKAAQTISFSNPGDKTVGDGSFELKATASSGLLVNFRVVDGPAKLTGSLVTITGAGVVRIEAAQPGNDNYKEAAVVVRSFTVSDKAVVKADQSISFAELPNRALGDPAFVLAATASSGLPVSYRIVSGPANLNNNNLVVLTGIGTVIIEASQPGNNNYNAASPVLQRFEVSDRDHVKKNQTVSFNTLPYQTYNSPPFELIASASSGLPVSFRVVSGPVSISGGKIVTINGVGFATIEAYQDGNEQYSAAGPVQRRFTVGKGSQSITFPNLPNRTLDEGPVTLNATASSGLPVSYRIVSGPATVAGNMVTPTGAGVVVIEASQPGDDFYNPSFLLTRSFVVKPGAQVRNSQEINFTAPGNRKYGDEPFRLSATATSGLPVAFRVVSGPVIVTDNMVTITGIGEVIIEASQAGDANFNEAKPVKRHFKVTKASQSINFGTQAYQVYSTQPFELTATATSGLPVVYRLVSGPVSIKGTSVNMQGTGFVVIEASQAGNENYHAAPPVLRGFTIGKAAQILSFSLPASKTTGDKPFALDATSTSDLPITYKLIAGPAVIKNNTVTLTGAGTVVIEASQPGNANYLPAFPLQRSLVVTTPANSLLTGIMPAKDSLKIGLDSMTLRSATKPDLGQTHEKTNALSVYPNPVTSPASVRIQVAQTVEGLVAVYDEKGRLVRRLLQQTFEQGWITTLPFDASKLQPGTYFLHFSANGITMTKKFLVIR